MKKIIVTLIFLFMTQTISFAAIDDYDNLYIQTELSTTKLMHNIDPFQDEEYQKYTYSPYPLFRTCSYLYFKGLNIPPGYYSLTPRKFKEKDFVLFKTNGKVQFIVPVVKNEAVPIDFYAKNIPVPKQTKFQKFCKKTSDVFYKFSKNSRRIPPPKSFIEVSDESNYFVIKLYYGDDCFIMAFKKSMY